MWKKLPQLILMIAGFCACLACPSGDGGDWSATAVSAGPPEIAASVQSERPCVLLRNDNVLFGQAYQLGEFVIVRTGQGGEVRLARAAVACWAGSIRSLYQYRVDQRQNGDFFGHLRDAQWCMENDLFDLATHEIEAAKKIDPNHAGLRTLEDRIRRMAQPTPQVSAVAAAEIAQVSFDTPLIGDIDPGTLRGFVSHVQPMLINRCGRCHSHDSGRAWSLTLPTAGARPSSRVTRKNLAASLPFIDSIAPESNELFVKAVTAHGEGPAPLNSRNAKAIYFLRSWLVMAASTKLSPTSEREAAQLAPVSPPTNTGLQITKGPAVSVAKDAAKTDDTMESAAGESAAVDTPPPSADHLPGRLPQVKNPFDPNIFNRRFHMKTTGTH